MYTLTAANKPAQLKGSLTVSLIGVNALLKRVELAGAVGHARLALDTAMKKIHFNGNGEYITMKYCRLREL